MQMGEAAELTVKLIDFGAGFIMYDGGPGPSSYVGTEAFLPPVGYFPYKRGLELKYSGNQSNWSRKKL